MLFRSVSQSRYEFNNYLNELRKGIKLQGEVNGETVWTKGFDEIFKEKELQRILADYGVSQKEYQEAHNDKEVAMRLSDALDEIANGKIAVFGKMVEEAKQAKNETARQKWQFEQDNLSVGVGLSRLNPLRFGGFPFNKSSLPERCLPIRLASDIFLSISSLS